MQAFLTIAGKRMCADPDIEATKQQISDVVRRGGGFVSFQSPEGKIDVLITQATVITVHYREEELVAAGASGIEHVFPDFDDYGI
jgi:hypothetical protein